MTRRRSRPSPPCRRRLPLESLSTPETPPAKTVEHLVREAPGPDLHEIGAPPPGAPAPVTDDGAVDFAALYQHAGLPAAPFSAEQMVEMLANLPKELALDAKRATVKATLNAVGKSIGATPETDRHRCFAQTGGIDGICRASLQTNRR